MDAHRIYDLAVVHLFRCILNLGPRAVHMLQDPRWICYKTRAYLNLALPQPGTTGKLPKIVKNVFSC